MQHEIDDYLAELITAIETLDRAAIIQLTHILTDAWQQDRMVILIGNGGSAATAAHMVNDLNKIIVPGMPRFHALALTDNIPLLTAWANDAAYERVFAEQMRNYCRPDDLVIALSCSGNSPNILEGVKAAREIGAYVVGVTGNDGGALAGMSDFCLYAPADYIGQQEDIHMMLDHLVTRLLRQWGIAQMAEDATTSDLNAIIATQLAALEND